MYIKLTPWNEVVETFDPSTSPPENPFTVFLPLLAQMNIPVENALNIFTADYYDAECFFETYSDVLAAFTNVYYSIQQKYTIILQNYPFATLKEHTRSPNLKRWSSASSSGSADVTRNQKETQTETPLDDYGQERVHSVTPYDSSSGTFQSEYKDQVKNVGSKKVETEYSGDPDHTESESSGTRTDTETGNETITEKTIGKPGQSMGEMLEDFELAASLFKMLEAEIAKKIFLQIWR